MFNNNKNKFTTLDGIFIIASCSTGGGLLVIPFLVKQTGIIPAIIILFISYIFTVILHFMIASASLNTFSGAQFIDISSKHLPNKFLKALVYVFMPIIIVINLSMYIIGSSIIISSFFNIPIVISQILFFIIGATMVFSPLKTLAINEGMLVCIICAMALTLAILAGVNGKYQLPIITNNYLSFFPLYGVSIFSLGSFLAVPQIIKGLQNNVTAIKKSIYIGTFITLLLIIIISISSILISSDVTEIATIGIGHELGIIYFIIYNTFAFLAMMSSYFVLCNVLKTIAYDNFHAKNHFFVIILTIPSFLIAFLQNDNFLNIIEEASGVMAIIIILLVIPSFIHSIKSKHITISNVIEHKSIIYATLIAYLAAAICNLF